MKHCKYCGNEKPFDAFPFKNKSKGTRHTRCKDCFKIYTKKWHLAKLLIDPTYFSRHNNRKKFDNREWLKNLKENTPCSDCGKYYPYYVMDFDHLGDKTMTISSMIGSYSKERIEQEMNKCQLVCSNCHRIRTWTRNIMPASSKG